MLWYKNIHWEIVFLQPFYIEEVGTVFAKGNPCFERGSDTFLDCTGV
jgi:hypothetical protein